MRLRRTRLLEAVRRGTPSALVGVAKLVDRTGYSVWKSLRTQPPVLVEPVFMIGCPRGGTSIAIDLFGRHPEVANWSEAGRTWDPVGYDDPEADHVWETDRVTPKESCRLHSEFLYYQKKAGGTVFANKHPRSSVRIPFINAVFPDARFIHVVRDGRAVVSSILQAVQNQPWRRDTPFFGFCKPPDWRSHRHRPAVEQAAIQWAEITRYVLDHRSALGARYHEVRYEELCENPRGVLRRMYEFAGLDSDASVINGLPEKLRSGNSKYLQHLSVDEISVVTELQRDVLLATGYQP